MVRGRAELVLGLIVAAIGAYALSAALDLTMFSKTHVPGPGLFPTMITIGLLILGVLLAALSTRDIRRRRGAAARDLPASTIAGAPASPTGGAVEDPATAPPARSPGAGEAVPPTVVLPEGETVGRPPAAADVTTAGAVMGSDEEGTGAGSPPVPLTATVTARAVGTTPPTRHFGTMVTCHEPTPSASSALEPSVRVSAVVFPEPADCWTAVPLISTVAVAPVSFTTSIPAPASTDKLVRSGSDEQARPSRFPPVNVTVAAGASALAGPATRRSAAKPMGSAAAVTKCLANT